jgi:hypothetical protein
MGPGSKRLLLRPCSGPGPDAGNIFGIQDSPADGNDGIHSGLFSDVMDETENSLKRTKLSQQLHKNRITRETGGMKNVRSSGSASRQIRQLSAYS